MPVSMPPHRPSPPLPSRRRRGLLAALAGLPAAGALAGILDAAPPAGAGSGHFLPVGEAFRVNWTWSDEGAAIGEFVIAPGYYLYRDRIRVELRQPANLRLAALELPQGEIKEDPYAGRQQVYHRPFVARQPIALPAGANGPVEIEAVWQGCAEAGLCYPPVRRRFTLRP